MLCIRFKVFDFNMLRGNHSKNKLICNSNELLHPRLWPHWEVEELLTRSRRYRQALDAEIRKSPQRSIHTSV